MTGATIRVAIIAAASAGAFVAGRAWPRAADVPVPVPANGWRPTPAPAVAQTPPPTPAPPRPRWAGGAELSDDFVRAVREDPAGAARLRSDVVVALEARRRQHNAALRACLDSGAMLEETQLRFAIEVRARAGHVDVGPAVMADVIEGPALTDATLTCLLAALDAHAAVDLPPERASMTYDGTIDVPIRFAPAR